MNLSKHVSEEYTDASCPCVSDVMFWFGDVRQTHIKAGTYHVSFEFVSGRESEAEVETFVRGDA